jgi:hypothetical protein
MKGKRYTEEQIISILKEHEAGLSVQDLIRKHSRPLASPLQRRSSAQRAGL